MINKEELEISNQSYTNKDFVSIYPELLDYYKKISPKYDPSLSNESDPGVVITKLLAFIGDKLNYNADKNILEAFMLSATQENSMRDLCERNGYFPKYYRSAETDIYFRYDGNKITDATPLVLPAFSTVVSDEDGEISYSLLETVTLNKNKVFYHKPAIQGVFSDLIVGDRNIIQLSDFDDNNRVYFAESMIAENSVFVFNASSNSLNVDSFDRGSSWTRVENLNLEEPRDDNYVFKFGYDSIKNLPYVEFPVNISNLIGEGLIIKYAVTKGINGNVKANTLVKLVRPLEVSSGDVVFSFSSSDSDMSENSADILVITNFASSINGADPETINEAYNSFKKTVGTFDTLVTSKDYANALYNAVDPAKDNYYFSNVQVADRRTDINYGLNIVTFSDIGKVVKSCENKNKITPYDLCVYPLTPLGNEYSAENYIMSFTALSGNDVTNAEASIEDLKTISHNYKELVDSDIYAIKNYYKLNTVITTNYKVTTFEQQAIKENIIEALVKAFNARKVDYGYEIPFDSILNVIKNSDSRIKNISLDEPEITSKILYKTNDEEGLMSIDENENIRKRYIETLARNILAGRLELFDYDKDFDYEFGQEDTGIEGDYDDTSLGHFKGSKFSNVYRADTEVKIPATDGYLEGYTLRENEVVQFIAPNISSIMTYPAYVYFRYTGGSTISDGEEHIMQSGEELIMLYTDSNGVENTVIYIDEGIWYGTSLYPYRRFVAKDLVIIKPSNLNITVTPDSQSGSGRTVIKKSIEGNDTYFYCLTANETIEERQVVERVIDDSLLNCYWKVDTENNELFSSANVVKDDNGNILYYERILSDNEYFAYCDNAKTELVILGSGTKLRLNTTEEIDGSNWSCDRVLLSKITADGLTVLEDFNWRQKKFSVNTMTVTDMQIYTLTENDSFRIVGSYSSDIDNELEDVDNSNDIYYTFEGDSEKSLPKFNTNVLNWKIRSKLNLNSGPKYFQELKDFQTIVLHCYDSVTYSESSEELGDSYSVEIAGDDINSPRIMLNMNVQMSGGENLDLTTTRLTLKGTKTSYDIKAYVYYSVPVVYETVKNGDIIEHNAERLNDFMMFPLLELNEVKSSGGTSIDLPLLLHNNKSTLIAFYVNSTKESEMSVILSATGCKIRQYNTYVTTSGIEELTDFSSSITLRESVSDFDEKLYVIEVVDDEESSDAQKLTIFCETSSDDNVQCNLLVGTVDVIDSINKIFYLDYNDQTEEILNTTYERDFLLLTLHQLDINNIFYYNNHADIASLIDVIDTRTADYLFSRNNIYNKFTIGEIDFSNSRFAIAKTSQL